MGKKHEYFLSYYDEDGELRCRCSLERLSNLEVNSFVEDSGIKKDYRFQQSVLKLEGDYQIPLNTKEEQTTHSNALAEFEEITNHIDNLEPDLLTKWWNSWDFNSIKLPEYLDEYAYIVDMWNYVYRADDAREKHRVPTAEHNEPASHNSTQGKQNQQRDPKSENEDDKNLVNQWVAQYRRILSKDEEKACNWLLKSQNEHSGKGWQAIADAERARMKRDGKPLHPTDKRNHARNIENACKALLTKIKGGYIPSNEQ